MAFTLRPTIIFRILMASVRFTAPTLLVSLGVLLASFQNLAATLVCPPPP